MDQVTLERLIRDALEHLNSRSHLATHRLTALVAGDGHVLAVDSVREWILGAIDQLRPVGGPASSPPDWRRYRHLVLRYVDGLNRDQVAQLLGVSQRQASRDHEHAIAALTTVLWTQIPRDLETKAGTDGSISHGNDSPASHGALSDEVSRATQGEENWAEVSETIKSVMTTLGALLTERGVSCVSQVPNTLPPIAINRTILRQIFLTLLSYVVEEAPGAEVVIGGTDSPRGVVLTIDLREGTTEIRGPSRVNDSPLRETAGNQAADLLEVAKQLLARTGGVIQRGDSHGHESLLTITLPPVFLRKILVIDDNPDIVTLFRRYLRGEPYRLIQSTSGESALKLVEDIRPDAIILDVMLPSADGWEILATLRQRSMSRDIPVVVCSILPEQALAQSLGVSAFLVKPVTQVSLQQALKHCLH